MEKNKIALIFTALILLLLVLSFKRKKEKMDKISGEKLVGEERKKQIGSLNGWSEAEGRDAIKKSFQFKNFKVAFYNFMTKIADVAEQVNLFSIFLFSFTYEDSKRWITILNGSTSTTKLTFCLPPILVPESP